MDIVKRLIKSKYSVIIDSNDNTIRKDFLKLCSKTQLMLILSTICALCSYILLLIVVARLYSCFEGKQRYLMITSLGTLYVFFAILLWFGWKGTVYKKSGAKKAECDNLRLHLNRLSSEHESSSYYLIVYALLLAVANILFFFDNHDGLTLILKLSTPVGVVAFLTGIYFMIKFKDQDRSLQAYEDKFKTVNA